jgi:hypothetical protein
VGLKVDRNSKVVYRTTIPLAPNTVAA